MPLTPLILSTSGSTVSVEISPFAGGNLVDFLNLESDSERIERLWKNFDNRRAGHCGDWFSDWERLWQRLVGTLARRRSLEFGKLQLALPNRHLHSGQPDFDGCFVVLSTLKAHSFFKKTVRFLPGLP